MKKERTIKTFPGNPGDLKRARKLAKQRKGKVRRGKSGTGYKVVKQK